MTIQTVFWKNLSINMLIVYELLFIGTITRDFFITIVIPNSIKSQIFSNLSTSASFIIIISWLFSLFLSSIMMMTFLLHKDYSLPINKMRIEYGGIMIIYIILFTLSIFTPAVPWIVVFDYAIYVIWIWSLIRFRLLIQSGLNFR